MARLCRMSCGRFRCCTALNHAGDYWFSRVWPNWSACCKNIWAFYGKGLHVSPTLFTPDMLNASGCQVLSQLAGMLDVGEAYVPGDIAIMRSAYQEAKQRFFCAAHDPELDYFCRRAWRADARTAGRP